MAAKICGICTSVDQLENVGAIATWKAAISAKTELGAIRSSTIRTHAEYISETSKVSIADSAIPSTTFPATTTTAENAYPRQLSISGRPNEVACNQQPGVPTICELQ
ncbi:hypothetical protein CR513_30930, partial [Mucuna pruriens]